MSEQTQTFITIALVVFVMAGFFWPLGAMAYFEMEERKKRKEPPRFDERQKLARLRAGNHALYALLGFLAVWTVMDRLGWFDWTDSTLDLALCAMLMTWGVWTADCVWHDGFVSWKDKRKDANAIALYYCIVMINFVYPFCNCDVTASWAPFIFACGNTAFLCGVVLYKYRREKRGAGEEEIS